MFPYKKDWHPYNGDRKGTLYRAQSVGGCELRQPCKWLEDIRHNSNRFANSLRKDYKNASKDLQNLRAEANLLRLQRDRLSGAVNALTKNREGFLVELHEQRELKKHVAGAWGRCLD